MNTMKLNQVIFGAMLFLSTTTAHAYQGRTQDSIAIPGRAESYEITVFQNGIDSERIEETWVSATLKKGTSGLYTSLDRKFLGNGHLKYSVQPNGNLDFTYTRDDGSTQESEIRYIVISGDDCLLLKGNYRTGEKYDLKVCVEEANQYGIDSLEQGSSLIQTLIRVEDLRKTVICGPDEHGGGGHPFYRGIGWIQPDEKKQFSFLYSPFNEHAIRKLEEQIVDNNKYLAVTGSYGYYWDPRPNAFPSSAHTEIEVRTELFDVEFFRETSWNSGCAIDGGPLSG